MKEKAVTLEQVLDSFKAMRDKNCYRNFSYDTVIVLLEELQMYREKSVKSDRVISFVVDGEPVAKGRPRFNSLYSKKAYTPKKTSDYESFVQLSYLGQVKEYRKCYAFEENIPIGLDIKAYFSIPKNTAKNRLRFMISKLIRPLKKPDIDNLYKIVADSLNKVAYPDDKQLVKGSIEKFYSNKPRMEITIYSLPCYSQNASIKEIERKIAG